MAPLELLAIDTSQDDALLNELSDYEKNLVRLWADGELASEEDKKKRKASRVWYGQSERADKDKVKELCRGDEEGPSRATFDFERKVWGTFALVNTIKLILSDAWYPLGIPPNLKKHAAVEAWRRIETKRVIGARRAHEKAIGDAMRASADERAREAGAKKRQVHEKRMQEQMLNVPEATQSDYDEAKAVGISRDLLDASATFPNLGPRSGLSTWHRVKRWLLLKHLTQDCINGRSEKEAIGDLKRQFASRAEAHDEANQREVEAAAASRTREQERRLRDLDAETSTKLQYEPFAVYRQRFFHEQGGIGGMGGIGGASGGIGGIGGIGNAAANTSNAATNTSNATVANDDLKRRRESGLDVILEHSKRLKVDAVDPILMPCPMCHFQPTMVQFLGCNCKVGWHNWVWCTVCNRNANEAKLPCACMRAKRG